MAEPTTIRGRRILVVEDDYFIAQDLVDGLSEEGASVLGPAATIDEALDLLAADKAVDCAVLDVNMHGDPVYPVADALDERSIPYVFATGYNPDAIDRKYARVACCEKPVRASQIACALFAPEGAGRL